MTYRGDKDDKATWSGLDLTEVEFMGGRLGGEKMWMEIDNVTFY
jgi:hypothetical protein